MNGVTQLRPSFQVFDSLTQEKKKEMEIVEEEPEVEEEEPKAIQVQIRKGESERAHNARKKSYAFLHQQREEEPWSDLRYFDASTAEANQVFERMFSEWEDEPNQFVGNLGEYLSKIAPKPKDQQLAVTLYLMAE